MIAISCKGIIMLHLARDDRNVVLRQLTMVSQLTMVPWSGPDLMRTQKLEELVQLKLRHDARTGLIWVSPFHN